MAGTTENFVGISYTLNDFHIENRSIYDVQYSLNILFVIFVACRFIKISKHYVFYSYHSITIDAAGKKIQNIILLKRFSARYTRCPILINGWEYL